MKPRLATVWLGGCSGCHMSFLDLDERLLELAARVEIVKSPIVDAKEFPEVDIVLVEGAVANEEHLHEIREIRRKARILVAFGDCAVTGNVATLRNPLSTRAVLERSYLEVPGTVGGLVPDQEIAPLIDRVRPVHEVVPVDVHLPGCPPSADLIFHVLTELLEGRRPVLDETRLKYG